MTKNIKKYNTPYQRARWIAKIEAYKTQLGGKCVNCGSQENLEFDHIDSKTKLYTITTIALRPNLVEPELKKCQLLCHDCHLLKTKRFYTDTRKHGTWAMYDRGKCRCEVCRALRNSYNVEWKRNKRLSSKG